MSENNFPKSCLDEGLTCEVCTTASARQLAQVCQGLRAKMVAQLFVQIYPALACSRMLPGFVAAYKAASVTVDDAPVRKGVQTEAAPLRTMTAAA